MQDNVYAMELLNLEQANRLAHISDDLKKSDVGTDNASQIIGEFLKDRVEKEYKYMEENELEKKLEKTYKKAEELVKDMKEIDWEDFVKKAEEYERKKVQKFEKAMVRFFEGKKIEEKEEDVFYESSESSWYDSDYDSVVDHDDSVFPFNSECCEYENDGIPIKNIKFDSEIADRRRDF